MLHGTSEAVLLARDLGQTLERIEIELDVGDRPVGEDDPTV